MKHLSLPARPSPEGRRGPGKSSARRRPPAARERRGKLEPFPGRFAGHAEADEEFENSFTDLAGPELLDAAFDEVEELGLVRGDLSERLRLHVTTRQRRCGGDEW